MCSQCRIQGMGERRLEREGERERDVKWGVHYGQSVRRVGEVGIRV